MRKGGLSMEQTDCQNCTKNCIDKELARLREATKLRDAKDEDFLSTKEVVTAQKEATP
jgi:hypothetical protein